MTFQKKFFIIEVRVQVVQGKIYVFKWLNANGDKDLTIKVWDRPWIDEIPNVMDVNGDPVHTSERLSTLMLSRSIFFIFGIILDQSLRKRNFILYIINDRTI